MVPLEKTAVPSSAVTVHVAGLDSFPTPVGRSLFAFFPLPAARLAGCELFGHILNSFPGVRLAQSKTARNADPDDRIRIKPDRDFGKPWLDAH